MGVGIYEQYGHVKGIVALIIILITELILVGFVLKAASHHHLKTKGIPKFSASLISIPKYDNPLMVFCGGLAFVGFAFIIILRMIIETAFNLDTVIFSTIFSLIGVGVSGLGLVQLLAPRPSRKRGGGEKDK